VTNTPGLLKLGGPGRKKNIERRITKRGVKMSKERKVKHNYL